MPVFLLNFATGLVGPRFAKPAIFAVLALLIVGALWGGKCAYDKSIIDRHEAKQEAATAKADRKADTKAAEQRRADDTRLSTETTEIKEAVNEARRTGADPRAAYYDCVRKQQAARHSGQPPANC
jgi:hypothetical protein